MIVCVAVFELKKRYQKLKADNAKAGKLINLLMGVTRQGGGGGGGAGAGSSSVNGGDVDAGIGADGHGRTVHIHSETHAESEGVFV